MKPVALLTTIPSDSHQWNLVFIEMLLEEQGFSVVNLGPSVPYELLLRSCRRHQPDVVVVSTINGHGYIEGKELIRQVQGLNVMKDKPIFIGGKLSTDTSMSYLYAVELEQAGYTKTFCNNEDMKEFINQLRAILEQASIGRS